jgi:hypothetical protein
MSSANSWAFISAVKDWISSIARTISSTLSFYDRGDIHNFFQHPGAYSGLDAIHSSEIDGTPQEIFQSTLERDKPKEIHRAI